MYTLTHLSDQTLLRDLASLVTRDRATTAELLAHLAEVEARKLYLPAAHPSMHSYCVRVLGLSEDAACRRIRAARAAREFPAIFAAVAEGRLSLTAVVLLAPHLTAGNAAELLTAAEHQGKAEIERLLAERFPKPELMAWVGAAAADVPPGPADGRSRPVAQEAPGSADSSALARMIEPAKVAPLAQERYGLQCTIGQETHDKLRYAQQLLGQGGPGSDLPEVIDRALDALIPQLEKNRFAATGRPRRPGSSTDPRHIPAHVKRAVWERDQGRCTFVSERGERCPATSHLEFDHVEPVARGGRASISGIRLRCRGHNQYEAERAFGVGFMEDKRKAARERQEARQQEAKLRQERIRAAAERAARNDLLNGKPKRRRGARSQWKRPRR